MHEFTISVGCPYSASRIAFAFSYPSAVNGSLSISLLTCLSNSSVRYPNLVRGARLVESILEVNFPQNGSHSSILPLNFVMDNLGRLAAEDVSHSSVSWVDAFCSRFFSNSAFCSRISCSNSICCL